jgi:hypothetical protein
MPEKLYLIYLFIITIGAFLGVLTFINQFVVSFKPRIFINNYFRISYFENKKLEIESIVVCLTISNSKNAYGIIDDISIGIHETNVVQPRYKFMFPEGISTDNQDYKAFSPIILSPKSHSTVFIRFKNSKYEHTILGSDQFNFDIFCKYPHKRKWVKNASMHLYKYDDEPSAERNYKLINFDIEREPLRKSKLKPEANTYKGNIGRRLHLLKKRISFSLKLPVRIMLGAITTLFIIMYVSIHNAINWGILKNIALKESRKKHGVTVTMQDRDNYVDSTFRSTAKNVERLIKKSKTGNPIVIKMENNAFELSRDGYSVRVISSGYESIYTSSGKAPTNINLEFLAKKTNIGYRYWVCDGKIVSRYGIALMIFDHFCLFSWER